MGYLFNLIVLRVIITNTKKYIKMKNSFKMGALALVIAVSFAACKGKGAAANADSLAKDSLAKDSAAKAAADTAKKAADTAKKAADTAKKAAAAADTAKKAK